MIIRDKNVVSEASGSEHHALSTLSRSLRYDPTYAQVSLGSPLGHVLGVHKEVPQRVDNTKEGGNNEG